MTDLGVVSGDFGSLAFSLNDSGQVVGGSCTQSFNCRVFLWQGTMTDLNTLVKTGSTSLYLVFGNDINSRGEIAAYAFDQSNGEFHAALAIPCDGDHADIEACSESATALAPATTKGSEIVLPANVGRLLQQRRGFGLFGAGLMKQQ